MAQRRKWAGSGDRTLMRTAAILHYREGVSQIEVSRRMRVSTATVSRLLARARDEGIVRIHIADPDEAHGIGDDLARALGLATVRAVDTGRTAGLAAQVGALLTGAELAAGSVLAIGWGRAVQGVISTGLPPLPGVVVVPTTGGMNETASHFQINEFVRTAAEQTGGEARFLHAPSNPSRELRSVLLRDPDTTRIMECWSRIDAAILGIGSVQTSSATRGAGAAAPEGAVGDVARHYFDLAGRRTGRPDDVDPMTVTRDELRRVPLGIGVATGPAKAAAIVGAARSGMIGALVTNLQTARAVLDLLDDAGAEVREGY